MSLISIINYKKFKKKNFMLRVYFTLYKLNLNIYIENNLKNF